MDGEESMLESKGEESKDIEGGENKDSLSMSQSPVPPYHSLAESQSMGQNMDVLGDSLAGLGPELDSSGDEVI
jgi:hypothetical protein